VVILAAVTLFLTGGGKRTLKMPRERNKRAARVLVREEWDVLGYRDGASDTNKKKYIYLR
jgi:hypothetical protein